MTERPFHTADTIANRIRIAGGVGGVTQGRVVLYVCPLCYHEATDNKCVPCDYDPNRGAS